MTPIHQRARELREKFGDKSIDVVNEIISELVGDGKKTPDPITMLLAFKTQYYIEIKKELEFIYGFNKEDEKNALDPIH